MESLQVGILDMTKTITIASDFSTTPGGRYYTDGDFTGQEFRERYLIPELDKNETIRIVLDGAEGYPSSFLEEAFGGLARTLKWTLSDFNKHIEIIAGKDFQIYKDDILAFVEDVNRKR